MPFMQRAGEAPVWAEAADLDRMLTAGYQPVGADVVGAAATQEDRGQRGLGGAVTAGLSSLAAGATLGLSDAALAALTPVGTRKDVAAAREAHPVISTGGNVLGALAPTILSGGAAAPESIGELAGGAELGSLAAAADAAAAGGEALRSTRGALSAVASSLPVSLVSRAGAGVTEAMGGRLLGKVAGGAAEGALFGAGNAVSDLALSDDPLTAEHIASTLSSNMLLGGAIGGVAGGASELVQRGLARASTKLAESAATRAAIEGVPVDLAGLDEKGLADAFKVAKADHAADVAAERQSLEGLRVEQRTELANQIRDLHEDLASDRPIYHAVTGADVEAVDGVKDAQVQLAKSFKSMRAGLDSELSVARDPSVMLRPLEMRQSALETIQQAAPEIRAKLLARGGADGPIEALGHVDDALAQTKAQIAAVRELKSSPLASMRLTALETGPSVRMAQIDAAREALKNAPEIGLLGRGAKAGAFAGVTAVAHAIPGVGLAAPFIGKAASDAVGRLFERASGTVGKVAEKTQTATQKFLAATKSLEPYTALTSTKVLGTVQFGAPSEAKHATGSELGDLYRTRASELLQQTQRAPDGTTTMRPQARAAMAAKLDPIRTVNLKLADQLEEIQARKTAYLASVVPKRPDVNEPQNGPDRWKPSELEMRTWARRVRAVEDPASVEERLARGVVTPQEAEAYRTVYPERFAALRDSIVRALPTLPKPLPRAKLVALSLFTGQAMTPSMRPELIQTFQHMHRIEPGSMGGQQAPKPEPHFGKFGRLKSADKPTPSQARQGE